MTDIFAVPPSYEEAVAETVERYRAMVAALEAECAALAEALGLVTHEFNPYQVPSDPELSVWCRHCGHRVDEPAHRTAAWVRKRYGFGAT